MPSLGVLSESNTAAMLLYIGDHSGCTRSDIYDRVTHNASTPRRIDALVDSGLVRQEPRNRGYVLYLTDKGEQAASLLRDLAVIMEEP